MNIKKIADNVYSLGDLGFIVIASPSCPPTYICIMVKDKKTLLDLIRNDSAVVADVVDFFNNVTGDNTKIIAPPREVGGAKYWATFSLSGELISFGENVL